MTCERPEDMRARIERKGYRTGTQFGSLMSQIVYGDIPELKDAMMLPTPLATDICHVERIKRLKEKGGQTMGSRKNGELRPNGLMDYLMFHNFLPTPEANNYKNGHRTLSPRIERKLKQGWAVGLNDQATLGMLPTPNAVEGTKYAKTYNPKSQMGSGLTAMAVNGMLPTPVACLDGVYADKNPKSNRHSKSIATVAYEVGGGNSQLSPLFVEEMMGFPTGWILLPFLKESFVPHEPSPSTDGAPNP